MGESSQAFMRWATNNRRFTIAGIFLFVACLILGFVASDLVVVILGLADIYINRAQAAASNRWGIVFSVVSLFLIGWVIYRWHKYLFAIGIGSVLGVLLGLLYTEILPIFFKTLPHDPTGLGLYYIRFLIEFLPHIMEVIV